MTSTELRRDLPPLPRTMRDLPVRRGYPVPWFVTWVDGEPDFRVVEARKVAEAIEGRLCWVCGKRIPRGGWIGFVVGPMCAVNRISAEPPQHVECSRFSALACPFLSRPHARRREAGLPEGYQLPPGRMIARNPGISLLWITRSFKLVRADGGVLFRMGSPVKVEAWREGRAATEEEIRESVDGGLPVLQEDARAQGARAMLALQDRVAEARALLGVAR